MIAREMNLSETAFVVSERNGFGLRWFTPRTEADLAGTQHLQLPISTGRKGI